MPLRLRLKIFTANIGPTLIFKIIWDNDIIHDEISSSKTRDIAKKYIETHRRLTSRRRIILERDYELYECPI